MASIAPVEAGEAYASRSFDQQQLLRHLQQVSGTYPSPAWKFGSVEPPRPTHKDYLFALETMNRKEARAIWRDGIKACWDNRCAFCNATPIDDESLTLDHVKPKSKGGEDLTRNLVPACQSCNTDKGSEDWKEWYRKQDFYCRTRELEIESWMAQGDRTGGEQWESNLEAIVMIQAEQAQAA
ncbi:HNH endonuclease family protein [Synechococcus sp. SYN20]|uniref:HNH endonuclease n=1 Tax=Synechococcus sp. SYN20 TaxID=1050714 RepID=UPI001648EBDD|nr:HNH endonuclease signature motif containing protein [Synechococcus sp. SYN20]QNJ25973.1 HNH endonuclease family protein [Synechococcus sp. SYN20]